LVSKRCRSSPSSTCSSGRGERVTGAVDQNVDAAVLGVDLLDESIYGGLIGDVERTGL
jgi:hypothetical protein